MNVDLKLHRTGARTEDFLKANRSLKIRSLFKEYGELGVRALQEATPKDTGLTASSWTYKVNRTKNGYELVWMNDNTTKYGDSIAILIQYGHGTGTGGWVKGRDYINPALKPVLDGLSENLRELGISK